MALRAGRNDDLLVAPCGASLGSGVHADCRVNRVLSGQLLRNSFVILSRRFDASIRTVSRDDSRQGRSDKRKKRQGEQLRRLHGVDDGTIELILKAESNN